MNQGLKKACIGNTCIGHIGLFLKPWLKNNIESHIFDGLFPSFFPHLYSNNLAAY